MKRLFWISSSKKDLEKFPKKVKDSIIFALGLAIKGEKHSTAKPFKGCGGGASVMEIVQRGENATFRLLYAAKFKDAIYVLLAFQKKSKTGIKTTADSNLKCDRYESAVALSRVHRKKR